MTDGASAPKKGLSPLAWVAIGCGGLILVAGLAFFALVGFGVKKAADFAEEMEANPAATMARAIAFANPEIDLVETDDETQTVTFRHTETGEEYVISFADIQEGKISFEGPDGRTEISSSGGDDGGTFSVTTGDGTATYSGGAGADAGDLPDWVPVYPGAEIEGMIAGNSVRGASGTVSLVSEDSLESVEAFYRQRLEAADFVPEYDTKVSHVSGESVAVAGRHEDGRYVKVTVTQRNDQARVAVFYNSGHGS